MRKRSKKASPQDHLWKDPDHGAYLIKNSVGVLAQLYRFMVQEIGIDKRTWERYLNDYIKRFGKEHPDRSPSAERGNVRKALVRPWMSWKTLLRGFVFLKLKNVTIIIEGELEDGRKIRVESQKIDLSAPISPMDANESEDFDATEPDYPRINRAARTPKTAKTQKVKDE